MLLTVEACTTALQNIDCASYIDNDDQCVFLEEKNPPVIYTCYCIKYHFVITNLRFYINDSRERFLTSLTKRHKGYLNPNKFSTKSLLALEQEM